jgi:hypothetical protein
MSRDERRFAERLTHLGHEGKAQVFLGDLTDFDWESVCYIGVYDRLVWDKEGPRKRLKEQIKSLPWVGSELYWGFVFIGKDNQLHGFRIPVAMIDTLSSPRLKGLDRSSITVSPHLCVNKNDAFVKFLNYSGQIFAYF